MISSNSVCLCYNLFFSFVALERDSVDIKGTLPIELHFDDQVSTGLIRIQEVVSFSLRNNIPLPGT